MRALPYTIEPERLALPWSGAPWPLAVIDLDLMPSGDGALELPPFPVIGVGSRNSMFGRRLDAVIEAPAVLDQLVRQVEAAPRAAAVLVELLRLVERLPTEAALLAESLAYATLQGGGEHARWLATRAPMKAIAAPGTARLARDESTLVITMDRPLAGNAIDTIMRDELREAFELAAHDPDIASVELRGAGRTFSLGADLAEFGTTRDPVLAHAIRMQTLPAHAIARCCNRLAVHVQGACIGAGLEMAAFASTVTATRKAWFQLPELAMGLIPGAGGCVSLSRRIGRQRTALLVLSGRRIGVRTAQAWGLVDALIDDD